VIAALAVAVVALAVATALAWGGGGGDGEAAPGPAGEVAALDGRALFAAKGCAVCHFAPGQEEGTRLGPDLGRPASRVEGLSARAYVRQSILEPAAFVVAGYAEAMPPLGLTPAEAEAIAAYLVPAR
jgi:cytochrome c oxidase subunit 2